jgi:GT2 family glycosyltransferase
MVRCILQNTTYHDFEVVVVDDGSSDDSSDRGVSLFSGDDRVSVVRTKGLGVAGARNFGAQEATGETFVFMDGHCYTPPGWLTALTTPLADSQVGMVGPSFADLHHGDGARGLGATWRDASLEMAWLPQMSDVPYPVPLLPGGCQVMRRRDFEKISRYDSGMTRWGSEDLELSLRTWLMGYQVVVHPQVVVYHLFRKRLPYHVDTLKFFYNRLRMAMLHLHPDRITRVFNYYKGIQGFSQIMIWLLESDVMIRRGQLQKLRCRDDDWFFARFGCKI